MFKNYLKIALRNLSSPKLRSGSSDISSKRTSLPITSIRDVSNLKNT